MYNKRTRRFKKGGRLVDDKKAMVLSQIKEVHHHADELAKVLANMDTVDAWVVGKMERATTDLSDITHYLDGTTEYAKGGMMDKAKYNLSFNYNPSVVKNSEAEKIVSKYTKDWKHDNDFDEVSFFVMGLSMEKAKQLQDELKMEDVYNIEIDKSRYADGGMMAKGGRIGKYILTFYCNPSNIDEAEKIVSKYTKEWRRSLDFGKNFFFVPELTWQKAKELENEISPFKLPYPFGVSIFKAYADGGMMAKGGNVSIKEGDKVIYEGEKRTVYALYPEGMASLCLIDDEDDYEYEDVEEDYQVSIKDLTPVKGSKKKNKQKGIDLFEDYNDIPPKVQKVLDKYQEDIEDGDYKGLEKALKELEKIGYTFEYGLDGIAYDLRPIGTQGKSEFMEF
jgi:ribosomal protein S17E